MKNGNNISKARLIALSAMCLALGLVLPFLTMQIPSIGIMLLPMHIPVLLCGFICDPLCGLAVGIITPLLRSVLFHKPAFYPNAAAMAFELGAYGFFSGIFYKILPKKKSSVYIALIAAMIIGRIIWGVIMTVFAGISGSSFTFAAFITGSVVNAIPGIVIQIILIPLIVIALKKSELMD